MEQERDTQAIFFKDLIFTALYQWKKILLVGCVLAILFGAFQVLSADKHAEINSVEVLALKETIATTTAKINNQQAYLENSVLMTLDPSHVYKATVSFYVHTDYQIMPDMTYQTPDSMTTILNAYQLRATSQETMRAVANALNTNDQYLYELVNTSVITNHPGVLNITVSYRDAEGAQKIADAIVSCLRAAQSEIAENTASHTINVIAYAPILRSDDTLIAAQKAAQSTLSTLKTSLQSSQSALDALTSASASNPLLMILIGAFLGAFAVVCITWVAHISSDKVYSRRTLNNRTGIKILGCASAFRRKDPVNRILRKLEGRTADMAQLPVLAAYVHNLYPNAKSILLTGNAAAEGRSALMDALKTAGIPVTDCGHLLYNAEAQSLLPTCDAVLLAEQCDRSRYSEIERTCQCVSDQDKPLIGCILLDG